MAVNAPFGFQLHKAGNVPEDLLECYSSDSTILGLGDAVILAGSYAGVAPNPYRPTVTRCAASGAIFGVVERIDQWKVEGSDHNLSRRHKPGSVGMYLGVRRARIDDIYKIQANGAVAVTQVGEVGNLATIVDANTTTGVSKMELDAASLATAQTAYQLVVRGYPEDALVERNVAYQEVLVSFNNIQAFHAFGGV